MIEQRCDRFCFTGAGEPGSRGAPIPNRQETGLPNHFRNKQSPFQAKDPTRTTRPLFRSIMAYYVNQNPFNALVNIISHYAADEPAPVESHEARSVRRQPVL